MSHLDSVVIDYIQRYRKRAENELRWFAVQRTLEDAVTNAALCTSPSGKRLSHQRRIPLVVLSESRRRLLEALQTFRQLPSFELLHGKIFKILHPIHGIGELTIYDTSLRIGAKMGLEPNMVFLHAGTRIGAKRLGLNTKRPFIDPNDFPRALHRLKPREIEDVLCIYKDSLVGSFDSKSPGPGCYTHALLTRRTKC